MYVYVCMYVRVKKQNISSLVLGPDYMTNFSPGRNIILSAKYEITREESKSLIRMAPKACLNSLFSPG